MKNSSQKTDEPLMIKIKWRNEKLNIEKKQGKTIQF